MSSYQIDLTPSLDPSVGIMLNVTEDHIDRHGSIENYAAVKERLVAGVQPQGCAIIGVDDGFGRDMADRLERAGQPVLRVSVKGPLRRRHHRRARDRSCKSRAARGRKSRELGGIGSLRGLHNAQNAACAAAAALALGVRGETLQQGLRSFPGCAHRMEQVGRQAGTGVRCSSTTPRAPMPTPPRKALSSFGDIFWIAGGKPKTGGIESLAEFFPRIRKAYLIGEAAAGIRRHARGQGGLRDQRDARRRGSARGARCRGVGRCPSRWCCCRRPAPRSTSSAISKSAAPIFAIW